MRFWETRMGENVVSSLGMSPWRRVANPIIHAIHLRSTWLSELCSIGDWRLPRRICSQPRPTRRLPARRTPTGTAPRRVLLETIQLLRVNVKLGAPCPKIISHLQPCSHPEVAPSSALSNKHSVEQQRRLNTDVRWPDVASPVYCPVCLQRGNLNIPP